MPPPEQSAHGFPAAPPAAGPSATNAPMANNLVPPPSHSIAPSVSGPTSQVALAYANAQLAQYAAAGGALPAHLDANALAAFGNIGASAPGSGASSPGAPYRSLPQTGYSTPGGGLPTFDKPIHTNGRIAASAITGKRLNWSDMICQTIAESPDGRLVIQDLFENMCAKFPEIREWAYGKDWEARVKNRIKSTLSIKGNLFIKVPRPSSAAGKGSWWTLSQEAQEAWKAGRVASVVKNQGSHANHARSHSGASTHAAATGGASKDHGGSAHGPHSHAHGAAGHNVGTQSAGPSSRHGSPVIGRRSISGLNGHSLSMTNLRNAIHASGIGQQPQGLTMMTPAQQAITSFSINPMTAASIHSDGFSSPFAGTGTMTPTAGFLLESLSMQGLEGNPPLSVNPPEREFGSVDSDLAARRMRMMENSVNDAFQAFSAATADPINGLTTTAPGAGPIPWQPAGPSGSSIDTQPSSLSPEDAAASSSAESDLSNPLEGTTAALLNSLGVEGASGGFYDNSDLNFGSSFPAFGESSAAMGGDVTNTANSFSPMDSQPFQAYTPVMSSADGNGLYAAIGPPGTNTTDGPFFATATQQGPTTGKLSGGGGGGEAGSNSAPGTTGLESARQDEQKAAQSSNAPG
ncbi:hypothetical protein K437DRAFT_263206 [Tilletiaria anomala UBC 951]|uniref:Fork-head domain-containing protein n=1 Tax=Tilletiaria anomala (strain ATCC 24038 / CBS 436.72 / UBC 951) TaxID=1037660 RepID=A0A066W196_TILAU|nr:uncharacterized protein K437DRAFT_263206 [Tilletiaria anomala UBC 951]KDN44570.1 hypothetical protein K437DRAFT_263206 [Tilletiaria anomala UBC 951]